MTETVVGLTVDRRATIGLSRPLELVKRHGTLLAALLLYAGFACYLTWPLVTNISHSIYGASGDPFGTMAFYRELVEHGYNPFLPGTIHQLAAPSGLPIPWLRDLASAPGVLALYLLTALFGPVMAYGVYTLGGYTLTGAATFLLARRLTSNLWASLIAGWAFAFYPFAVINGQYHPDLIQGWVIVLAVWRILELLWYPTRRNGVLAGLAVVLAMWWTAYFILFVGVCYVVMTATAVVITMREHRFRTVMRSHAVAVAIVVSFSVCLLVLSKISSAQDVGIQARALHDLYSFGARPVQYLAPDAQSVLFGSLTGHYAETHLYGAGRVEGTLYVGLTILALAAVAVIAWLRGALGMRASRAVVALSLLAICCAVTSMPPTVQVAGVSLSFPSRFIAEFTTTWRIYTRFVIVVMLAVAMLAAIGFDSLTRGRSRSARIVVTLLVGAIVALDLWAPQRGHVSVIETPAIYGVLERQPLGLVAEYPMAHAGVTRYLDRFYQGAYQKPTINGYEEATSGEQLAFSLSNLELPSTIRRLATLGVRYVLVRRVPLPESWWETAKPAPGLSLIAQTPDADLYTVDAKPQSPAVATTGEGFVAYQISEGLPTAALEAAKGEIELFGSCTRCRGHLTMLVDSPTQQREMVIADGAGHTLLRRIISRPSRVSLPVSLNRHETLTVIMRPGPPPENPLVNEETVTLAVAELEFVASETPNLGGHAHGDGRKA